MYNSNRYKGDLRSAGKNLAGAGKCFAKKGIINTPKGRVIPTAKLVNQLIACPIKLIWSTARRLLNK